MSRCAESSRALTTSHSSMRPKCPQGSDMSSIANLKKHMGIFGAVPKHTTKPSLRISPLCHAVSTKVSKHKRHVPRESRSLRHVSKIKGGGKIGTWCFLDAAVYSTLDKTVPYIWNAGGAHSPSIHSVYNMYKEVSKPIHELLRLRFKINDNEMPCSVSRKKEPEWLWMLLVTLNFPNLQSDPDMRVEAFLSFIHPVYNTVQKYHILNHTSFSLLDQNCTRMQAMCDVRLEKVYVACDVAGY
jgi:hypothetical protein